MHEIQPLSGDRVHIITKDEYPFDFEDPRYIQYFSYIVDRNGLVTSTTLTESTSTLPKAQLSPNPVTDYARVSGLDPVVLSQVSTAVLIDLNGREIQRLELDGEGGLSIGHVAAGAYFLRLLNADERDIAVARFIKH